jgi:antitoxin HigA-1
MDSRALNVPPCRVKEVVLEKRGISAETALRLARCFGTSAEIWAGFQDDYDLLLARLLGVSLRRKTAGVARRWNILSDFPTGGYYWIG